MADIANRFNLDMLTLTGPIEPTLAAQGVDVEHDAEFMLLVEPDTVRDAYRLQMVGDTPVLVTDTAGMTPARLALQRLEDRAEDLAKAALAVARSHSPQHVLVELGPCGLPLDPSSEAGLEEHRNQYARVARVFEAYGRPDAQTGATAFDGYLLRGFTRIAALTAAIAGLRRVSTKPIFACVAADVKGHLLLRDTERIEDAAVAAVDAGADVVGFSSAAAPADLACLAARVAAATDAPLMVEVTVFHPDALTGLFPRRRAAIAQADPYATPESMLGVADALRRAGVQFLRAGEAASPAYTAVLAAATFGLSVARTR